MASNTAQVQARLACHARGLLWAGGLLAKHTGLRIPHSWVVAVVCRSWSMKIGDGPWKRVRIDARGQVLS